MARARRTGHPWSAIGVVLGLSRQGAQQRFAHQTNIAAPAPLAQEIPART